MGSSTAEAAAAARVLGERLPQLAGRANEEIRLGHLRRVQSRSDRVLVDVARIDSLLDDPPRRLDDFGAASLVEGDPELEPFARAGLLLERRHLRLELRRGAVAAADEPRAHALLLQVRELALDRLDEDLHQRVDLVRGTRPVLRREGVDAERFDPQVERRLDRAPERARTRPVAG